MKPQRLEVSAFGPYAAKQVFDFAELNGRSFFLIHGATGAGKTSILDGICFALYGQTSGMARSGKQMRSDHAAATMPTRVVFDFSLRGESYRVIRAPEQERPRKRGTGLVMQDQEAEFFKRTLALSVDDNGTALDGSWSGVNARVEELMGFKCDQFRQVVLLPQGQFQKLLMDGSADRQRILETLFRVESYAKIEDALKSAAIEITRANATLRTRRGENLRQAGVEKIEDLEARRVEVETAAATARAATVGLRTARQAAGEALAGGRDVLGKLKERDLAAANLKAMESRKEEIALKQIEHGRAVKAAALADLDAATRQRAREADEAARKLAVAAKALTEAEARRAAAEKTLAVETERQPERDAARDRIAMLAALDQKVAELAQANAAVIASQAAVRLHWAARAKAEQTLQKSKDDLQLAEKLLQETQSFAAQTTAKAAEKREADAALKSLLKMDETRKNLTKSEASFEKVKQRVVEGQKCLEEAREKQRELHATWVGAVAATLAQELKADEPCPVCGSAHHPHPAQPDEALPQKEELDAARATIERYEKAIAKLQEEQTAVDTERQTYRLSLGFLENQLDASAATNLDEARRRVDQLQAELLRAETAGLDAIKKQAALDRLRAQLVVVEKQVADAGKAYTDADADLRANQAVAKEREAGIDPTLRLPEALAREKAAANRRQKTLADAYEMAQQAAKAAAVEQSRAEAETTAAKENAQTTSTVAASQQSAFAQRLLDEGFATPIDFEQAKRSPRDIAQLDEAIRTYHIELTRATERVRAAAQAAEGLSTPDLAALEKADSESATALESGVKAEADLLMRLKQIDDWLQTLRTIDAEQGALEARYQVVGKIADVATGSNRYRISFQRYVLGVFLDEVLGQANLRLKIMSWGRFRLQRSHDPADTRKPAGLDLEVFDDHTGKTRPVATLSGGESFLASLSLALGLADVVQEKAGGVHLETIFIDEGFGTLDPETLDLAIRALRDLQKGGRLVGIISHVTELKEWIDARLEVTTGRAGSSAKFVLA